MLLMFSFRRPVQFPWNNCKDKIVWRIVTSPKETLRETHTPCHAQQSPQKQSSPPPQVGRVCRREPGQSGRSWTCGDSRAAASRNEPLTKLPHWRHNEEKQFKLNSITFKPLTECLKNCLVHHIFCDICVIQWCLKTFQNRVKKKERKKQKKTKPGLCLR